ncbi:glycosyltransferase [Roseococcus sp. SYP-B2431]|uniref:glycosyltransferase family 2 protein n=1 Tax=Roseococcus sp. SYP-B2431 TaxID=2496640 RepID=UPI00103C6BB0|nr:glycosyltransferase family 2 protein [Roseococcus sp. SYP-B2431]TCH96297.1 glycosyltransferase [Roseococcus sp. SYP-B2431]
MRISIVCPVYDTPPHLLAAAAFSVLGDPSAVIGQLVLVDDGSRREDTLRSLEAIAGSDPRVTMLRAPHNLGPAGARNLGLLAAREEWIGFLDSDDAWLPDHASRLGRLAAQHPEASWIGAGHRLASPEGSSVAAPRLDCPCAQRIGPGLLRCGGPALTRVLLGGFHLHLGAMVVRRGLAAAVGGFAEGLGRFEDLLFTAKLSRRAPLFYLDADAYRWRRGEGRAADLRRPDPALRMHAIAAREPELRPFGRELRRARHGALRGLALDTLIAGRRRQALALALRGWTSDPREIPDLLRFLRLWLPLRREGGLAASGALDLAFRRSR